MQEKCEYLGAAETAKVVRKILKNKFPGVKFSVRSDTYSMGSSVRVKWTDGPTDKQIERAVGALSGSGFDGMIDLKYYIRHWLLPDGSFQIADSEGTEGSGGFHHAIHNPKPHPEARLVNFADSISPSRSMSKEFMQQVIDVVSKKFGGEVPRLEGSDEIGYWIRATDYHQERLYCTIAYSSIIRNGKLICLDHMHGGIVNRRN